MKSVEPSYRRHKDSAAECELRLHSPFDVSLLDVDFARSEFVLDLRVENNVLLLREHRGDAKDQSCVLKRRSASAIGSLVDRRLAKLKISVPADRDAICSQK